MLTPYLLSKLHRATVTGADLHYEGSIALDPLLIEAAQLRPLQQVEIYNINNGERFSTYVIGGSTGEVSLNGAAARRVQAGDLLIICAYGQLTPEEAQTHHARIVLLGEENQITTQYDQKAAL